MPLFRLTQKLAKTLHAAPLKEPITPVLPEHEWFVALFGRAVE